MAGFRVPVCSQRTADLCWEACARMLWHWRYNSLSGYAQRAGNYPSLNRGLTENEMNRFYQQLGLRSLRPARGANIRHALQWTPVIFTSIRQATGHAMVATNYNNGIYSVINPCAVEAANFTSNSEVCPAGPAASPAAQVEGTLGSYIWYW